MHKPFFASLVLASTLAIGTPAAQAQPPIRYAMANNNTNVRYEPVVRRRVAGPRYVVKRRSKAKSAAIVGGSAAGGAAIGALAGGGKGAVIGALVGGGGGLIYDRKTHKKVVRQY